MNLFDDYLHGEAERINMQALYQYFKQKAAIYPNISVDTQEGVDFCSIVISNSCHRKVLHWFSAVVITPCSAHYQYYVPDGELNHSAPNWHPDIPIHTMLKTVELADPKMLEIIDGWICEMALQD